MPKRSKNVESADGIAQASKLMGVPLALLRAAKRAGAPGFRHGRVYFADVKAWLEKNDIAPIDGDAPDIQTAKLQKVNEEVRKLKLINDRNAGKVIDRAIVAQSLAKMCAEWNAIRVRAEAEAPAKMAGLEAAECRVVFRGVMDDVGAALAECHGFFTDDGHANQS